MSYQIDSIPVQQQNVPYARKCAAMANNDRDVYLYGGLLYNNVYSSGLYTINGLSFYTVYTIDIPSNYYT